MRAYRWVPFSIICYLVLPSCALAAEASEEIAKLDLVAQQAMAYWTEATFYVAAFSAVVSIAALFGLFWSLQQTRSAIRNTRELGEAQTQAYVHAASADFINNRSVIIDCKNTGATPAPNFSIAGRCFVTERGTVLECVSFSDKDFKTWPALGSGIQLSVNMKVDRNLVYQYLNNHFSQDHQFVVCGTIRYSTVFGDEFETQFAFFSDPSNNRHFSRPTIDAIAYRKIS